MVLVLHGAPVACYGVVSRTEHLTATTNEHESLCVRVASVIELRVLSSQ